MKKMDAHWAVIYTPMSCMVVLKVKELGVAGCKKVCWEETKTNPKGVFIYLEFQTFKNAVILTQPMQCFT